MLSVPKILWGRRRCFGWSIVFSCTIGVAASSGPILLSGAGVLMEALHREFGWDRGQVSFSVTLYTWVTALMMPTVGLLIDRFGVRRMVLPAILALAVALSLMVFMNRLWQFYAATIVFSLIGSTTTSLPYVRVVSSWFDRRRGLMLGIVAAGIGIGFSIVPIVMQALLERYGWRGSYLGIAAMLFALVFPIQLLLLRDSPSAFGLQADNRRSTAASAEEHALIGDAFPAALRSRSFWLLLVITLVFALVFNGMPVHLIPMLKDKGIEPSEAVFMASMMGLSLMASRVVIGVLLDVVFAPRLAMMAFLLGSAGLALLALGDSYMLNLAGAVLIGVGIGAETDVVAYMVSRYFGLKSFGRIYGTIFTAFYVGTGLGPLALGLAFESQGSYRSILLAYAILSVVLTATFVCFGAYKYAAPPRPSS
ncbi:MAG: MFS transporter [Dehalococcoidia bacterium]